MRGLWALALLAGPCIAQADVVVDWIEPTGGVSIAVDPADNVFTIHYEYNPAGDITLTKRDSSGALQWERKYDQVDPTKWERASWVAADDLGNALVAGTVMSGYSNPVEAASVLMKFAPDGTLLWRQVYESTFDGSYTRKCLVDEAGATYVLGMGSGPAGYATKVKKFAADGTVLWTWFDVDGIGAPVNFKFTPDGGLAIAARAIFGAVNGYAKIDREGNHLWSHPGVPSLTSGDAAGDADGNTYLVHGDYAAGTGSVIRKIAPGGALLWAESYDLTAYRVEVGSDARPVICGLPGSGGGGAAFLKADADGSVVWSNPDADGPLSLLLHAQLLIDGNDDLYLAAGTLFEMAVCKVGNDGASRWTVTTTGSYANGIALGANDDVYVVGGATAKLVEETPAGLPTPAGSAEPPVLAQSYPNPCRDEAIIGFRLPDPSDVTLRLYDAAGRELRTLAAGAARAGEQSVSLDTSGLATGIYLYELRYGNRSERRTLTVLR